MKVFSRGKSDTKQQPAEPPENKKNGLPESLKKQLALGTLLAILGIGIITLGILWPQPAAQETVASPASVASVKDVCSEKNNITFTCYKNELTQITQQQGPEKAMALVKAQYPKIPYVKSQCHQLTHVIGRAALTKYHDDVADTYAHGDQYCWSGYYHGAMEELSKDKGYDYIIKNANSVCAPIAAKGKYSFYHYNCVHGLGHGYMFATNGELFESLTDCDAITDSWERTSCYGGVFMQNIMNEQTPDKEAGELGSKYLKADQPMYPCTDVEDKYKDQCYLMQTSYALQTVNYDFKKVFALCDQVETAFRDTCYTSLGRDASGNSISDADKTRGTCLLGTTEEAQRYCVHGAAMDFVSYFHSDVQAKKLCNSLPSNLSGDCLQVVTNYYKSF
jgi:hypothetical protein